MEKWTLDNGIDIRKLKPDTLILVATKNSIYKITKANAGNGVIVHGGKHLKTPKEGVFTGSTFGGSMIKLGWIGFGMHMEVHFPDIRARLKSSAVKAARVIGDGWEYDMEWK